MHRHQIGLTRRLALLLGLAAAAPQSAHAATLRTTLASILPPGLDPATLGAELHAAGPIPLADCLHRAGLASTIPDHLAARITDDFAAGRVLTLAGWHLSHTEAWLCAALHSVTNM